MSVEDHDDLTVLERYERSDARRAGRWNRRLANLATLSLLGGVAWMGAELTWHFVAPPALIDPAAPPAPTSGGTADGGTGQRAESVRAIIAAQLFGAAQAPVDEAAPTPPETTLDLRLRGIVFSDVESDARAIIAGPSGPHFAYGIGDTVPGDADILSIQRDRVLLQRNGMRELLRLEQPDALGGRSGRPSAPDRRYDERGNYDLARMLGGFQARLRTDPAAALSLVRLVQERNGDTLVGVRIYPGPERGFFEQVALEPGDLITHVNGIAIDSTSRGLEALRALTAADELELRVVRGDRRLAFAFTVSQ